MKKLLGTARAALDPVEQVAAAVADCMPQRYVPGLGADVAAPLQCARR